MLSYCHGSPERNWITYLIVACSIFKILKSFQNRWTQIQLKILYSVVVQKISIGLHTIGICYTVQYNDIAKGIENLLFIEKIELDTWRSKVF